MLITENNKVSPTSFHQYLRARMREDLGPDKTREMLAAYDNTLAQLRREVYGNIKATEPSLTDHGMKHVTNVQDNVLALLREDDQLADLSGIEIYCLGMLVLFHDAGNVYGRKDHQDNVGRVFDKIRGTDPALRREKTLIVKATRAHTGTAQDGSCDTLRELGDGENLEGKPVRLRQLAAILRFADELAEGPQRTSSFMQAEGLYEQASRMHHEYASSTHVSIHRATERIVVIYEIGTGGSHEAEPDSEYLSEFLTFVYRRLIKLDQERQYARHYSKLLLPFRSTEATFNFHYAENVLDFDMPPLKLTDRVVVPGQDPVDLSRVGPAYAVETLVPRVVAACLQERTQ